MVFCKPLIIHFQRGFDIDYPPQTSIFYFISLQADVINNGYFKL